MKQHTMEFKKLTGGTIFVVTGEIQAFEQVPQEGKTSEHWNLYLKGSTTPLKVVETSYKTIENKFNQHAGGFYEVK